MGIENGRFDNLSVSNENGAVSGLLSAVARVADKLSSGNGWPDGVSDLLQALGEEASVSRVWVYQTIELTGARIVQNYAFEWVAASQYELHGSPLFSQFSTRLDCSEYRALVSSRKRGEWQKVISTKLDPSWLRTRLEAQGVKSMLTIPIMVDNQWWGTLGFDDCVGEYNWTDAELAVLKTAAGLIANVILAKRLEVRRKQFDLVTNNRYSAGWSYDLCTGLVRCTPDSMLADMIGSGGASLSLRAALGRLETADRSPFLDAVRTVVKDGDDGLKHEVRLRTESGVQWIELVAELIRDESGKPVQLAGVILDINDCKQEEERLQEEATIDSLTGVMNRRMFDEMLRDRFDLSMQTGAPFALLHLDLDKFKDLNDQYGRDVGDRALRFFTDICAQNLRENDVVARLDEDGFAVLLPGARSDTAYNVGERIRRYLVSTPYLSGTSRVFMTTSVGLAVFNGKETTPEQLMTSAAVALVAAKKAGRNCLISATDPRCASITPEDMER